MFTVITAKHQNILPRIVYAIAALPILLIAARGVEAAGHAPTVSFLPDQYIKNGVNFPTPTVYFRAWDPDGGVLQPQNIVPTVMNREGSFYTAQQITIGTCQDETGCPETGGFKMLLSPVQNGNGAATVTLTVTDAEGLQGTSSFTMRKNSAAANPPLIANIPSESVELSKAGYGPVQFVIDDEDESGVNDAVDENGNSTVQPPEAISDNDDVVLGTSITFDHLAPRTWIMHAPPAGVASGRAVITVTAKDKDDNPSDTSFVLNVIDDGGSTPNTPPSFDRAATGVGGTWVEQTDTSLGAHTDYAFKVSDAESAPNTLVVTATSSNADLVPNDSQHLSVSSIGSNGRGTVSITPLLPLPGLKAPQAATITLTVSDKPRGTLQTRAAYNSRLQFLFVMRDQTSTLPMFLRPTGVFNLDPARTEDHHDKPYVTGEMRGIKWRELEDENGYHFNQFLPALFTDLPANQVLSLNIQEEPCDIAANLDENNTWCDTSADPLKWGCNECPEGGVLRAVPWNEQLQTRRENFLQALAKWLKDNNHWDKVQIINPNVPGGNNGIRELLDKPLNDQDIPGYTRENFLMAVQHELRAVQDAFPGKLVQIGYFRVDDEDNDPPLWKWLYPYLANEFNGIVRPRVSFFQEDLASNRPSAVPDFIPYTNPPSTLAYMLFPDIGQLPSFEFYCDETGCNYSPATYNNGITYQANTEWSAPLTNIDKTTKTLNSTPNDALEGSFNSFFNQYLELYPGDLAHADTDIDPTDQPTDAQRWQDGLQSWKDYTDHLRNEVLQLEAPAGLTVVREAANHSTISWFPVYSPTNSVSYTLQRRSYVNGTWTNWSPIGGICLPAASQCVDTTDTSAGTPYAYRVQAYNGVNPASDFSQVDVFLSEATYDGYVKSNFQVGSGTQPGIRAGRSQGLELRGILSFNISALGNATALAARLNLKQTTPDEFVLGSCLVDSKKGTFGALALQGTDFSAFPSHYGVSEVPSLDLDTQTPPDWVSAELNPDGVSDVSNTANQTNHAQFRLSFPSAINGESIGWNSSEVAGSQPHLVVQYKD
jgi:hypothetical protein